MADELDPWETQEIVCGLVDELIDLSLTEVKESARKKALVPYVVADVSSSIMHGTLFHRL